jgi:hypothetical protein
MANPLHRGHAGLSGATDLARLVPSLAPELLHELVLRRGLDACGDLVALATPSQLTALMDLDLWRAPRPGHDDQFDSSRFVEWLETLTEVAPHTAARVLAALDPLAVVAGLTAVVRVFDPATVEPFVSLDGDLIGADAPDAGPSLEIGGYRIVARVQDGWDAVVAVLVALEADHADSFHRTMTECRRLSNSRPEADGLDHLMVDEAQLRHEMAIARETRRERQGYATAADARAFLQMARQRPLTPVTARRPAPNRSELVVHRDQIHRHLREWFETLGPAGSTAHLAATAELATLTNILVSGCSLGASAFRPEDASRAAMATCNLGLEMGVPMLSPSRRMRSAFELGWSCLHRDVSMFTVQRLIDVLAGIGTGDTRTHVDLLGLRRALARAHATGAPWIVRDALDVLSVLDVVAWTGLLGLVDECPVLPAVVDATVARHTGRVSATDFTFVSTLDEVTRIRAFVDLLPALLAG